jgi:hypothetical protein
VRVTVFSILYRIVRRTDCSMIDSESNSVQPVR